MNFSTSFYKGAAGTGKTTASIKYLETLSQNTDDRILILIPQKTLGKSYYEVSKKINGSPPDIFTIAGLATQMVELFWPTIGEEAGFLNPEATPVFLNLESSQYFMAKVMEPLLEEGAFNSVIINRNRLYTQVIDNLNKAALNGFSHTEIETRLSWAAPNDSERNKIFSDAQLAAIQYREFCLANNLIDFSLQIELFTKYLWQDGHVCKTFMQNSYQHLIVDNLEETTPIEQEIISSWLATLKSALLVYDLDGGYRTFLGADAKSAIKLENECDNVEYFSESYTQHPNLKLIENQLSEVILKERLSIERINQEQSNEVLAIEHHRFFPQLIHAVAEDISSLIHEEGVSPSEIVVLSPFLSDALRFSLVDSLNRFGIKTISHRPSRPLGDEPVTHAMLTMAKLVHPSWGFVPTSYDISYMLMQSIDGLDLVRAQLLAEKVYQPNKTEFSLFSFDEILPDVQSRITFKIGEKYQYLRNKLITYMENPLPSLDILLSHLFGEVVSVKGYGFHNNPEAGIIIANLIDSIKNFRSISEQVSNIDETTLGKDYINTLEDGVIAAQYIRSWNQQDEESVLLLPATTYLMRNQPVEYQFWLDVGSSGWYERIFQPVTQPFLLNKNWEYGLAWTDFDEVRVTQEALDILVKGLLRRCKKKIYLGISDLSESGYEMQGDLLKMFNQVFQQIRLEE
jgi:hypothetical protein